MGSPVSLRDDFDAARFGRWRGAREVRADWRRFCGAMRRGSVLRRCARVLRFNAAGPAGLVDKAPGQTPKLNAQRQALLSRASRHPLAADRSRPMGLGRVPGFGLEADPEPGTRDGFPQAVRPAASSGAERTRPGGVQKNFPALVADIANSIAKKLSGIATKNKITRRWARRGTRPRAPHDQRTRSGLYLRRYRPQEGKGAALVLPFCNRTLWRIAPSPREPMPSW